MAVDTTSSGPSDDKKAPDRLTPVVVAVVGALASVLVAWITATAAARPAAQKAVTTEVTEQQTRLGNVDQQVQDLEKRTTELTGMLEHPMPIGTVIASLVPPGRFSGASGDAAGFDPTRVRWVPADGRSVAGSRFAAQGASAVPDLRGLFLRGINESEDGMVRSDAYADPDGVRRPGQPQQDSFQIHGHKHEQGDGPDNPAGTFKGVNGNNVYMNGRVQEPAAIRDSGEPRISKETRPKNAAIYYYVRIN
jgi:hypothetical protein